MSSNAFLSAIEGRFHTMSRYEDVRLQRKALSLTPVLLIEQRAQERMRALQKRVKQGGDTNAAADENISIQEMLLVELLAWFKHSFFEWVDSPDCDYCYNQTEFSHMSNDPNLLIGTDRVEMHRCKTCPELTSFPRYEDLNILLDSREGRCGEWANVFTLFCRAQGWDARLICDETDHAWTEVYSIAQQRWLHCDPCENILDNPLMYESGWGKHLSYIIAYSAFEVQDVTWRYSSDHAKVRRNRNKCSELDLIQTLIRIREQKQKHLTQSRKTYLTRRSLHELVELMVEKNPSDSGKHGRTSGSLAWRLQRGETKVDDHKIWSPTPDDLSIGSITIRYSSVLDRYERIHQNAITETVAQWQKGVYLATNIFRKEETDWQTVYLCRQETASEGEIQWRFEAGNTGKRIDKVRITFDSQVFENGQIAMQIIGDDNKIVDFVTSHLQSTMETAAIRGSSQVTLRASLGGGVGPCAWQHAQLFRRLLNTTDYPFSVTVTFK